MKNTINAVLVILAVLVGGLKSVEASPIVLVEDFEAPFPAWEAGWLGVNSNLQNYYGVGQDRGNNPDGLWVADDDGSDPPTTILFTPAFGQTLTYFSIDVASFITDSSIRIFDSGGVTLFSSNVTKNDGAFTNPGTYINFAVASSSGIGGFEFLGFNVEGNTSIDNVSVTVDGPLSVPDPGSFASVIAGFLSLAAGLRWRRR